jgi:hypothetical protein
MVNTAGAFKMILFFKVMRRKINCKQLHTYTHTCRQRQRERERERERLQIPMGIISIFKII